MKILVTGAAGFIGGHVAEALAKRGDEVVGLDNFNDYYDPAKKRRNAQRLKKYPNFRLAEADIRNREQMFALFAEEKFVAVAHIAAMAGVRNAVAKPALYVNVNLNGSQNLMDAALAAGGLENFVCASTSSIYGNTKTLPFVESDPCDRPIQPYAASKRAAEMLGYSYHYLYKLNFTALRFFTVYGPHGRPDMMPYLLAESIYKGVQIPLYEGDMRRDWTYVEDTVKGVVTAIDRPLGYEIINLGRGEPVALADFIDKLEHLAGRKANLISKPKLAADMYVTYADISKARRLLDFKPSISVDEGVKRFWDWYQKEQAELASG